jgi:hypothetical protein
MKYCIGPMECRLLFLLCRMWPDGSKDGPLVLGMMRDGLSRKLVRVLRMIKFPQ